MQISTKENGNLIRVSTASSYPGFELKELHCIISQNLNIVGLLQRSLGKKNSHFLFLLRIQNEIYFHHTKRRIEHSENKFLYGLGCLKTRLGVLLSSVSQTPNTCN